MLNKIDEEKALKTLKKPFKLQSCRRDIFTKKEPIDRMGMIAPVNTGTYRGPRGSAYRKYNVHESPIVENGLFDDPHKEELDWILDKHDTSYKPNCFDTLPPYATQLARSTYGEPSPSTRLGRKRPLPVVPLPKVQKKMKPDSGTSGSGMVSKTLALSSRVSNSKASGSIQPSSSFQSSSSSRPSSSVPSISFQASSSSRAPSSTPFEEYDKEDFDDFEQFDFGRYGFY
ncbi:uncharacterized protein FA14DRAFT_159726 [Meira miltonrushii]|uniref:Uncharacterized protein n=1 Tax=Meira miltonrushii TaxID=1280837 RepID=A0A316VJW4_9BASI|nr:uncharacterized protein FA14DRAFT_159726 [Meira miltonrushii]PWN37899.1 hypothetical protein FA14DRAFT_159726 [Meira miltonrushii]